MTGNNTSIIGTRKILGRSLFYFVGEIVKPLQTWLLYMSIILKVYIIKASNLNVRPAKKRSDLGLLSELWTEFVPKNRSTLDASRIFRRPTHP